MREIKFRVWDAEIGKMVYPHDRGDLEHHVLSIDKDSLTYLNYQTSAMSRELMQFTGLKDKNGKEIYEGDVIEYEWDNIGVIKHEVKFVSGGFVMQQIKNIVGTWAIRINPYNKFSEVIGNIYENPELLKI